MINLCPPQLLTTNKTLRISSSYGKGKEDVLWFEINKKYFDYIDFERLDSFVVGLLLHAMVLNEDIHVNGKMSQKLHYQLNYYLIPAIALSNPKLYKIQIHCANLSSENINNSGAVATGFSGGVDSFSTIAEHSKALKCPEDYQITHFTFFNVGSNGDAGGEKARDLFNERYEKLSPFPEEVKKDFIKVDSNISEVLNLNFKSSCTVRSIAPVLLLQKLFQKYYHSSSYRLDVYKLDKDGMDYFDLLNLQMLSTESVSIYSTGSQYSRIQKTKLISEYEPSYRYLNVCVYDVKNCSICYKCLRTLLTLELQGNIHKYEEIFDLAKYYRAKPRFIAQVIADRDNDPFSKELFLELKLKNYRIPAVSYLYLVREMIFRFKKKFKGNRKGILFN